MLPCIISLDNVSLPFNTSKYLNRVNIQYAPGVKDQSIDPGPKVIKLFSCSTQLSIKFSLLINLKLLIIANSFLLIIVEHEKFSANKYENANYCWHFQIYLLAGKFSCSAELSMKKVL